MFIIELTYKVELEQIDQFLGPHIAFLNEQYKLGTVVASGRKVPRTGGIIFAKTDSKETLEEIIAKDPFYQNDLADYTITEFAPTKTIEELRFLME
ncbi:YciI family protein [Flagellimonas iocasae]|uniref:YciI family protein n=1 Tax=Flagellimonas iocasae TaxID=2055905 RepID=A0ABW4Y0A9_9FLAO